MRSLIILTGFVSFIRNLWLSFVNGLLSGQDERKLKLEQMNLFDNLLEVLRNYGAPSKIWLQNVTLTRLLLMSLAMLNLSVKLYKIFLFF